MTPKELRKRLKAARAYAELSQEAFGAKIGRSHAYVSEIENGSKTPTEADLLIWAKKCRVPAAWFEMENYDPFSASETESLSPLAERMEAVVARLEANAERDDLLGQAIAELRQARRPAGEAGEQRQGRA